MRRSSEPSGRRKRRSPGAQGGPTAGGPDEAERARITWSFLASALTHEIKQPLNSLNLNTELLTKRLSGSAQVAAAVAGPVSAMSRVVDRINDSVEAFAQRVVPESVPRKRIDLQPVLEWAVERAQVLARRTGVTLLTQVERSVPRFHAHPAHLAVALDALLTNAIQASTRGGKVLTRLCGSPHEVRIEVVDEGEGMTPEVVRRAAEIGFSTRGAPGIGMTVAKFIAYHHAGGFHLESKAGAGTRAVLVLPVAGV